jgi:D-lactate dehydrogenase
MINISMYDISAEEKKDFKELEKIGKVTYHEDPISQDNIDKDAEIISMFVSSTVTAEMIKEMPKLTFIACRSTGFNNVDFDEVKKRKITVANVPTYGEHTVAEFTVSLMLAMTRKLLTAASQYSRHDTSHEKLHGTDLHGKTLGVIGAGKIGRNVIKAAKAFGLKVIAYDPFLTPEMEAEIDVTAVELNDLLKTSDIITLHTPLTKDNYHLIDSKKLDLMKDGVYIVNTARGELLDTEALVMAIKSGKVAGAALDVLEDEKLIDIDEEELLLKKKSTTRETLEHVLANTMLMHMPEVILTGHNAYNTSEAIQRINLTSVDNIQKYSQKIAQNIVH